MENSFTIGNGKDKPMMITYNNVTKSLDERCVELECSQNTLRRKILKVRDGLMSWDEAMLGKAARKALEIERRVENIKKDKPYAKVSVNAFDLFNRRKSILSN